MRTLKGFTERVKAKEEYSPSLKYPELWHLLKSKLTQEFDNHHRSSFYPDSELSAKLAKFWTQVYTGYRSSLPNFPSFQPNKTSLLHHITNIPSLSHWKPAPKEAVGKSESLIVSAVPVIVSLITCQHRQQIDGCPTTHPPALCPEPSATHRIHLVGIITFITASIVWFAVLKLERQHNDTVQLLPKTPGKLKNKQDIHFH